MSQPALQLNPSISAGILLRRVLALLADCFLIGIVFWVSAVFIGIFGLFTLGIGWLAFHVLPALPFAYYTLLVGGTGATPGQRLFGLIVRQEGALLPPSLAQAFVWSLLLSLSFAFACIPFLVAFLNPRHRATHDILSGLVILRAGQIPY